MCARCNAFARLIYLRGKYNLLPFLLVGTRRGFRLAPFICYEIAYSAFVAREGRTSELFVTGPPAGGMTLVELIRVEEALGEIVPDTPEGAVRLARAIRASDDPTAPEPPYPSLHRFGC